jgi:hypothetical protein
VSPWLAAAVLLFVLFVVVGVYSEGLYETLDLIFFGHFSGTALERHLYGALVFRILMFYVPWLGALALIWAAFASPRWSDKTLWSSAMILTTAVLSPGAQLLFSRHTATGWQHLYPNSFVVTGLIAYGSWLLIVVRGTLRPLTKRALSLSCAFMLLFAIVFPLVGAYIRLVDIIGSILLAGAFFSAGVFVAQRCGVDLFIMDSAGAER